MKNLIVLFAIVPFLFGASCKDETVQPDIAFACKINGKDWRPYENDFKLQETECHLTNNGTELFVFARNTTSREHIGFIVSTQGLPVQKGTYNINSDRYYVGFYNRNATSLNFSTGNGYEGTVEIKNINHTDRSIQGSFNFKAFNATSQEVVIITEGRFNLKYTNY